jgi:hypothetical protein
MSFEMFTESGNNLVTDLVKMAKTYGFDDAVVLQMMNAIGNNPDFAEITDTAVRETVGIELGWY